MFVRPTEQQDIAGLQLVLDGTGLFPGEMLPGMVIAFLSGRTTGEVWLTCEDHGGAAIGFCYAIPEKLTEGTWNMLAVAVLPAAQGKGVGRAIVLALEDRLRATGQRLLIVDTSGLPEFDHARRFYRQNGYEEEARIRDFWAAGNDKIVFRKKL